MKAYGGMYPFGEPGNSEIENGTKTYENFGSWIKEHDAKVRVDTIDECIRVTNECSWKDVKMLVELFEKMKERN